MPDFSNENKIELDDSNVNYNFYDLSENGLFNGEIGALMPLWCRKTIPGDKFEIADTIFAMSTNPLVTRPMERVKIFTHYYYMESRKMWKGWKNYIDKGIDGNQNLLLPWIKTDNALIIDFENKTLDETLKSYLSDVLDSPMSLKAYLDHARYVKPASSEEPLNLILPWTHSTSNETIENDDQIKKIKGVANAQGLNALPFFMYQSIYKWYYMNWNLTKDNKNWLPENEDDWILSYNATEVWDAYIDEQDTQRIEGENFNIHKIGFPVYSPAPLNDTISIDDDSSGATIKIHDAPTLLGMRYRQWRADDYTTALPWLERSDITPQLWTPSFTASMDPNKDMLENSKIKFDLQGNPYNYSRVLRNTPVDLFNQTRSIWIQNNGVSNSIFTNRETGEENTWNQGYIYSATTMQAIRNLAIMTSFVEQSAQCDGSYNDFIKSFYDYDPKAEDLKPKYIGGTEQDIVFSEVLQTSADATTPLGTQAGRAISAGSGYVGKFTAPDHGYIMCIASIVPETRYAQGRHKEMRGKITSLEEYLPKLAGLGPEEIIDNELYERSTIGGDKDPTKTDLFGYRKRFETYMHGNNTVHNMLAIPPETNAGENYYTGMSFARFFEEPPKLNNDFVTMTPANVRRDMFSVPTQPMFTLNYTIKCEAYRKIPKNPQSAGLTNII